MMKRSRILPILLFISMAVFNATAQSIKHTFIAIDEARDSLVYTDENNPAANWSVHIDKSRDMQLVGHNRVMISLNNGYAEYDLTTHQRVKNVIIAGGISGIQSCRRLSNGNTLAASEGIIVRVIDSTGIVKRTVNISGMSTFRLMRNTSRGTWLFGSGNQMIETDTSGAVLKRVTVNGANNAYKAVRCPDGSFYVSTGYLGTIAKLDSAGILRKTFGGKPGPSGFGYNFFADFNILDNGHVVTTNWPGHNVNDGANCKGLIEYDTSGAVVWSWMDHLRASSLHAVIILDGLNRSILNDEQSGNIRPVDIKVGLINNNIKEGTNHRKYDYFQVQYAVNLFGQQIRKDKACQISSGTFLQYRNDAVGLTSFRARNR